MYLCLSRKYETYPTLQLGSNEADIKINCGHWLVIYHAISMYNLDLVKAYSDGRECCVIHIIQRI